MKPVLITGATGLLGSAIGTCLADLGRPAVGWGRSDADLTQPDVLPAAFGRANPAAMIHCGAWTDVDRAEDEPAACRLINVDATAVLAGCAARRGIPFIYISSGGVFDGTKTSPYDETDSPAPRSVYHRSKLDGERAAAANHPAPLIVRIGWLFGGAAHLRKNFVAARLREAASQAVIHSSTEQTGSPTWSRDAAKLILRLLAADATGTCHVANSGMVTRLEYVESIVSLAGLPNRVEAAPPGSFQRKAPVPANESLCSVRLSSWNLTPLRPWREALAEYLVQLKGA